MADPHEKYSNAISESLENKFSMASLRVDLVTLVLGEHHLPYKIGQQNHLCPNLNGKL
jgi:hypothetical protein